MPKWQEPNAVNPCSRTEEIRLEGQVPEDLEAF